MRRVRFISKQTRCDQSSHEKGSNFRSTRSKILVEHLRAQQKFQSMSHRSAAERNVYTGPWIPLLCDKDMEDPFPPTAWHGYGDPIFVAPLRGQVSPIPTREGARRTSITECTSRTANAGIRLAITAIRRVIEAKTFVKGCTLHNSSFSSSISDQS